MEKLSLAIFPGTFDPLTNGHVDIVRRTLKIFDRVMVAVLTNPEKHTLFTLEERLQLIRREFDDCRERIDAQSFSGLLVDFAKRNNARVIVRGLRAISDYDYEAQMALMNRSLCDEIETFFLVTREENSYISSTLVKQIALLGGGVEKLVPPVVLRALKEKFRK